MSYEKHKTSNKRILGSGKYKSDAKDKVASNDTKKKKDINERSKYCSELEAELIKKHIERSVPSSSQEFQNSKTFNGLKFKRKFSCTSDDCTSIAEDEPGGKVRISQEESLYFKSNVTKILNELKEICSEYELKTEYVRWHHLKKELVYQASANSVIKKSMNVIKKLKIKLDNQETKLMRFSKEWNKKCCARNIRHDDSISSGGELLEIIKTHDTSNALEKSLLSEEGSIFYCSTDSDETFFDNEVIEAATEKNKTNELSLSVIILEGEDNNNENITSPTDNEVMSPILGSNNEKLLSNNAKANRKPQIIHKSADVSEEFEGNLINDSSEDLVKRGMTENDTVENTSEKEQISLLGGNNEETSAKTDQNKGDKSLEENEFDTEIYNEFLKILALKTVISEENASSKTDDSESTVKVGKDTQSSWDEIDDDEVQADIARFRCRNISDLEPVPNNVSASEKSGTDSNDLDRIEKAWDISINKNSLSSNDNIDIVFLDSNTDHSMDSCSTFVMFRDYDPDNNNERNKQAKALLLDSSNSEDSSTDYDDSPQLATVSISSKKQEAGDELESPQDETLGELDPWLSKSVKKKPHNLNSKYESEEKLRMQSYVPLERLPEEALEKHDGALKKSRQHLDDEQIKSLTNLKALGRYTSKASGSSQSSTFKKFKVPAEREDTLLDHLKRVESGELTENIEEDAVVYYENRPTEITSGIQSNNELMMEANNIAKNLLLNSDSSNFENQNVASPHGSNDEDKREEAKPKSNATKWIEIPRKQCVASNVDAADKREESMWKRHKLLTMTFSSSDSEVETAKWDEKRGKLKKKTEENQTENSIMDPDSDTEMADDNFMLGMKQRKTRMQTIYTSPDTDSLIGEEKAMSIRNRIRKMNADRDNDDNSDDEGANCQEISVNKGRKNIRKVMKDMQVAEDTKRVAKEEEERLQRIVHRQKLMYQVSLASKEKMKKLVLDFDTETKEELVSVHPDIVKRLKPHQAKGIKFMWDVCFESLERTKSSSGSGCILAHCMGLGKCLQVIALLHTLLNHEGTGIKVIAIVCPLNTILNWYNEFNLWLGDIEGNNVIVYELTKLKENMQRRSQLKSWHRTGGVLLISYEMFRRLTCTTNKMLEATRKEVLRYLIDPGPDLIICDEGHLLKNEDTALSRSMKRIKTLRRIALTGTPLQNNLIEYHCMVQFVKPYLLGTKKEFLNRFVNPINNGQYDNSTENDVRLMKQRAYVLHKMLRGCVQRFNYSVLTPLLPPKQEYVIFVRLSDVQIKMYRYYLDNFARCRHSRSRSFFSDYQMLQKICTHPVVMCLHAEKAQKISEKKFRSDAEGLVRDFTDDNTEHNLDIEKIVSSEEIRKEEEKWWTQFIESDHLEDISISSKLMLFFGILKESEQIGDKLLVFSQFLHSLTLIENFLRKIDDKTQEGENSKRMGHRSWSLDLDYFRLDGQTSAEKRIRLCKEFNSPTNTRARLFLISTRAGGLGINLTAANRVILFDVSWNPSNDVQSIFRVYRFGQKKPSYVYRFLAAGTMEEKIYNRQVTKLSLSCRVVDEQQIGRHYRIHDLNELYTFEPNTEGERPTLNLPKDRLLAEIFLKYKDYVENYHEHDSLLENMTEEELNEEERKQAWQAFRLTSDTIYRD